LRYQYKSPSDPSVWYDIRGLNGTLANETAVKLGADWILKIDSDQVCYKDVLSLTPRDEGITLYQYEFVDDGFHLRNPKPDSPYNDSVFIYKAKKGQYYGGGMGPQIFTEKKDNPDYHCAHLRYANPIGSTEKEKLDHFFGRFYYTYWTNNGYLGRKLEMKARIKAKIYLKWYVKISRLETFINPPEVTLTDPLKYIIKTHN
jgi:hypothetical protein